MTPPRSSSLRPLLAAMAALVVAQHARAQEQVRITPELARLIQGVPATASVGICVRRTSSGELLFDWAADSPFPIGGAAGLLVGAAAEEVLGGVEAISLVLATDGTVGGDGTLRGHLFVKGPSTAQGELMRPVDHEELAIAWAELVAQKGVKRVDGDIVVIDGAPAPPGGPVPAQLLVVRPGAAAGAPTSIELRPVGAAAAIQNQSTTTEGAASGIVFDRGPAGGLVVRGTIGRQAAPMIQIFQGASPTLRHAEALLRRLPRAGITVRGTIRLEGAGVATPTVYARDSRQLLATTAAAIHERDLKAMDGLLRLMGLLGSGGATAAGADGERSAGSAVLRQVLGQYAPEAATALKPSSSPPDMRLPPRAMSNVLSALGRRNVALRESLPQPGTLPMFGNRLLATSPYGNLSAVVGPATEGNVLAGFVETGNGSYTIVVQAAGKGTSDVMLDGIVVQLVKSIAVADGSYNDPGRRPPPPPGGRQKGKDTRGNRSP